MNPFFWVNRGGSPAIVSSGVTVNTDNVVFTFPSHSFLTRWFQGSIFVNLAQAVPASTTGTLPIIFSTNGVTQAVTKYNGQALTVADLRGTGVYEFWFDRSTNTLQVMSGIV